jgi:hypothetical protein
MLITIGGLPPRASIWSSTVKLVDAGQTPPDADLAAGTVFSDFSPPAGSSNGRIAFAAQLANGGVSSTDDEGIWLWSPGSPTFPGTVVRLVRKGDPAPGIPGATFGTFVTAGAWGSAQDRPVFNGLGELYFRARYTPNGGSGAEYGIWKWQPGPPATISLVMRAPSDAPGPAGATLTDTFAVLPAYGGAGVYDLLSTPGGDVRASTIESSGALAAPLREGDPAPGISAPATISLAETPPIPDSSGGGILSTLLSNVDATQNHVIWSFDPTQTLNPIVQKGVTPVPGEEGSFFTLLAGLGATYSPTGLLGRERLVNYSANGARDLVFVGTTTSGLRGIWKRTQSTGVLAAVAKEGATNFYANTTLTGEPSFIGAGFNNNGTLAFIASLAGANVTSVNDTALFRTTTTSFFPYFRKGDPLQNPTNCVTSGTSLTSFGNVWLAPNSTFIAFFGSVTSTAFGVQTGIFQDFGEQCTPVNVCSPNQPCSPGACANGTCNSQGTVCNVTSFKPSMTVCRPAAGPCDTAESCTGTSANCPADLKMPANSSPAACNDNNACTADFCDGTSNACQHSATNEGVSCGTAPAGECTAPPVCSAGQCIPQFKAAGTACADDGNTCTFDLCDGASPTAPTRRRTTAPPATTRTLARRRTRVRTGCARAPTTRRPSSPAPRTSRSAAIPACARQA